MISLSQWQDMRSVRCDNRVITPGGLVPAHHDPQCDLITRGSSHNYSTVRPTSVKARVRL